MWIFFGIPGLPDGLKRIIRDRYLAGIADAEAKYQLNAADEDALTGSLGSNMSMAHPMTYSDGRRQFEYQVSYRKIRGRGAGAPERHLGADGIFQIEVKDETGAKRKGLPFQSKKGWRGKDSNLLGQTINMIETAGGGIVIDYRPGRYTACLAHDVVQHQGNRRLVDAAGKAQSLGQLLGNDFLDCTIGQLGLYFDPETETWQTETPVPPSIEHVITTQVSVLS
ncbi:hypothetical protein [Bradyrhizobium sp. SZCCHNPS2010]|uniref:hypothetical protein n=1 Tax=Bradyrhizobium sp. SZCCHNPS2010 TaxID=3057333 RepID=UPI002915E6B5|nr:hypothetical protein [Bradyrhizobium sp. SZCCHNPS2010]